MIAVIYNPETGEITQTIRGDKADIALIGSYLEVAEAHDDYDVTHIVKNGILTPIGS